jgi:hypothetical protein
MSFELRVEFRGLCMFVVHPTQQKVTVVMPDGRRRPDPFPLPNGERVAPHAGYLSCALANVMGPQGTAVEGQVVHQFARETLRFGLASPTNSAQPPLPPGIRVPDLDCVAPSLRPIPGVVDGFAPPPAGLLMRAVLEGGDWAAAEVNHKWKFEPERPAHCGGGFAGCVVWTTTVEADHVDVHFDPWEPGGSPTGSGPVRLWAMGAKHVTVEIANVCAHNPLRWDTLDSPELPADGRDVDFLLHYQLLKPEAQRVEAAVTLHEAPIPVLDRTTAGRPLGSSPGCNGVRLTYTH